jgi:hypothetical protein
MSGYGPVPFLYSKDVASVPCKGPKIKIASFEKKNSIATCKLKWKYKKFDILLCFFFWTDALVEDERD